ncbi:MULTISPECIES: TetR/AcrR family transcriptional regulator [unclassified Crossiella]|uniref:TetR/AcrR family transcriptional regulator n=1 Tax=unclassified Crossiella TaxID=2620835 RepID=UPI001FFEB0B4|nr:MULTISPECIES: TetR/AcrR family transcriptional regulator [unclassified Crossiella]MCK2243365.1 TetR/AcrR family transcriptional regulator [Crossiella sp. S99.2]MCK2254166.1 TetR/AcrR family transcriptional regulator [Crossiella sp. S99.1]
MAQRTRLSPDLRRAQLLKLGVELLSTRTLDELSIDDLAAEAGISTGLLFHYFGSKREFHLAVARAAAAQLLDFLAPDPALPPVPRMRQSLIGFVDYVTQNRDAYTSLVRGAATGDEAMRALFEQTRTAIAEIVLHNVDDLGIEPTPKLAMTVRGWVAFAEEVTITWLRQEEVDRDGLLELLERGFFQLAMVAVGVDAVAPYLPDLS